MTGLYWFHPSQWQYSTDITIVSDCDSPDVTLVSYSDSTDVTLVSENDSLDVTLVGDSDFTDTTMVIISNQTLINKQSEKYYILAAKSSIENVKLSHPNFEPHPTVHYTLQTLHETLQIVNCNLDIVNYTLLTLNYTLHIVQYNCTQQTKTWQSPFFVT